MGETLQMRFMTCTIFAEISREASVCLCVYSKPIRRGEPDDNRCLFNRYASRICRLILLRSTDLLKFRRETEISI